MTNVFENLNPYKVIVFITHEAAQEPKGFELAKALQEDCGQIITVIQMDKNAECPNGVLPQSEKWLTDCVDNSELAAANHMVIGKNMKEGPIADAAAKLNMMRKSFDTSLDDVLTAIHTHSLII